MSEELPLLANRLASKQKKPRSSDDLIESIKSPRKSLDTKQSNESSQNAVRETRKIVKDVDDHGNKIINNYVLLNELGRGVHGKVKLGRDENGIEWVSCH